MNSIPRITVVANGTGWWATCNATGCDWNAWHARRPAVDYAAHVHQGTHNTTQRET